MLLDAIGQLLDAATLVFSGAAGGAFSVPLLFGWDGRAVAKGNARPRRDNMLDDVPLGFGHTPAGCNGNDVAEAERVVGVVDEVRLGIVEELGRQG